MSADPTTLLGTIASLQLAQVDELQKAKEKQKEAKIEAKYKRSLIDTSGFSNFTDWSSIERPRVASLNDFNNNYLSQLAINGADFLRFQAKLNPNTPFNKK